MSTNRCTSKEENQIKNIAESIKDKITNELHYNFDEDYLLQLIIDAIYNSKI